MCRIQTLIFLFVLSFFVACDNHAPKISISDIDAKPVSLDRYFQLDTSKFHYQNSYHPIFEINKVLKIDNVLDTTVDLEIRILTTKHFDTTYFYRLKLQQDTLWTGEEYILEYLTQKLIKKKDFVPIEGWSEFQSAIITNDLLACDINKIIIVDSCNFIHPRDFSFQIISSRNMKVISFGSFYEYLHSCNIKQPEFGQMTMIMNSLFDKNNSW